MKMQRFVLEVDYYAYAIISVETDDDIKRVIRDLKDEWYEDDYCGTLIEFIFEKLTKMYETIHIEDLEELPHIGV